MNPGDAFVLPHALPVLLLAPLAWGLFLLLDRARARRLAAIAGPRSAALAPDLDPRRRGLRRWLLATGLLFALLAALQPAWGASADAVADRGADVILCLDVSRSMLARDVPPSRLARAQLAIRALAEDVGTDRFALVVFAGEARLLVPLTRDVKSLADMADTADPLSVGRGGTDLGAALEAALDAAGAKGVPRATIVLLTDGEDLGGRGLRVAATCRERGIPVHCVAFGSALGSKIAVTGARGDEFVRDRSGGEVVSALDAASLRRIAEATGGTYAEGGSVARPLADVVQRAQIAARASGGVSASAVPEQERRDNHFQGPLAAAFILWILDLWLTDRRR